MSVPNSHPATPSDDLRTIELLTQQALDAAQSGDWDRVDACYEARGERLAGCRMDRVIAQRLLAADDQVRAAILVAQAGLSSQLAEAAQTRRHLRRLRECQGQGGMEHGSIHHEA
ncbi:MAG: hypothetical protein JSR62_00700 [Nitrospira sp.]|nr:hypothetical protein [Nitrospira sp.]